MIDKIIIINELYGIPIFLEKRGRLLRKAVERGQYASTAKSIQQSEGDIYPSRSETSDSRRIQTLEQLHRKLYSILVVAIR